jgi:hypothetical protein
MSLRSIPADALILDRDWTGLVRRVANDHVELHIASKQLGHPSLDVVGVDERIGVGFKPFAAVKGALAGAAVLALAINPRVLHALEPDVARVAGKDLAMECLPLACFEQYTLRRASRLVRW